jgi:hypothetical protein
VDDFSCHEAIEKMEMLDAKIDALVERLWKSFAVLGSEERHRLELELEEAKKSGTSYKQHAFISFLKHRFGLNPRIKRLLIVE